jgi:ribonucleoside-diphosphate reductase beta chain
MVDDQGDRRIAATGHTRPERYARLAVEHHWDPAAIDLEADAAAAAEIDRVEFTRLRGLIAQFGAGEQTVTEDLAPLAVALDDPGAERFVATQLYDEARHAELFERYWERVIRPAERERRLGATDPTDERWRSPGYEELFDRTTAAMERLLERDAPETRARAYAHYQLTVEGVLARTAYEWVESRYGEGGAGPHLPGLVEGFGHLRRDEGRHVGFGVTRVADLIDRGAVDPDLIVETTADLVPLVETTVRSMAREGEGAAALVEAVGRERRERLEQVGAGPEQR